MAELRELHNYMYKNELKVLILDVRTREVFDYEHIRGDAVVCIEPSVLLCNKWVVLLPSLSAQCC